MKKARIVERTNLNGNSQYYIQKRHWLFKFIWIDAKFSIAACGSVSKYKYKFDTLEHARKEIHKVTNPQIKKVIK